MNDASVILCPGGLMILPEMGGQLMKFIFKTFGKVSGTAEPHLQSHLGNRHVPFFQQLNGPLETIGPDIIAGRLPA
jgi:hypothetical protein